MLTSLAGDVLLSLSPDRGQVRGVRAGSDLPKFTADMTGCPCGLCRVGAAHMQERSIGQAAQIDAVGRAESGERRIPGGAFVWAVSRGLRADRLDGMVIAV